MNTNKIVSFLKNKNTVTALASILIVIILVLGYNIRVSQATTPVQIPYANRIIEPRTKIDESMIDYMSIPSASIKGKIYRNRGDIVGRYTKENVLIPNGSFFYVEALTEDEGNTEEELYEKIEKGETLNYIKVNLLSSYSNSIVPGNYIDIYAYVQDDNKNKIAKLLENIKVIAVRTSSGENVFESSTTARIPYVIYFGLPYEQDMLLKKIHAINSWGAGVSGTVNENDDNQISTNMTSITLTPIPTTVGFDTKSKEKIKVSISSTEMEKIINDRAEDLTNPDTKISNDTQLNDNKEDNDDEDEDSDDLISSLFGNDKKDNKTDKSVDNNEDDDEVEEE